MTTTETFNAINRFGLGPGLDESSAISDDPRAWLIGQIRQHKTPATLTRFANSATILEGIHAARMTGAGDLKKETAKRYRQAFGTEVVARAHVMVATDAPFMERMVLFWSNHFTVSRTKAIIGPAIPAYEREAIRPHVFGRFTDMLHAVCRHPVMLSYLDNNASIGDNSKIGKRRRRRTGTKTTLNENLAREILELHTLGVDGGYTQTDVIEFAKAISGWSHGGMQRKNDRQAAHGGFQFRPEFHEPGSKTVMGKTYAEEGPQQGLAILDDLARHPATATFVASKLARHFVADAPSQSVIEKIARVFLDSDGDLGEVSTALVELEAAWSQPLAKVKSHYEFVIAVNRAMGNNEAHRRDVLQPLVEMGQSPFAAPSPAGWGDEAKDWVAPEALMRRIEWVHRFAARLPGGLVPADEVDRLLGPLASKALRREIQRAPSGKAAMALVLASSEFQRR